MGLFEHKDIYFKRAFLYCAKEKEGHGGQTAIALSMGVSLSYINQIATGKKNPGLKAQQRIADACGYDYDSFLQLGHDLIQKEEGLSPTTEHRSIKQTPQEVCKGDAVQMDQDVLKILQDHIETLKQNNERERQEHRDAMAELRQDYRDLKTENKELRNQLLEQHRALQKKKSQPRQSPDKSKKTAVNQ